MPRVKLLSQLTSGCHFLTADISWKLSLNIFQWVIAALRKPWENAGIDVVATGHSTGIQRGNLPTKGKIYVVFMFCDLILLLCFRGIILRPVDFVAVVAAAYSPSILQHMLLELVFSQFRLVSVHP